VDDRRKGARLVALALLGLLLFNYPFLALVSDEHRVLGIPVLYAYLFLSWAVLIALLALVVRKSE
jgi:hypothetical protein